MPRWDFDVALLVESKNQNQTKWQIEGEFVPTASYELGQAQLDADALMAQLLATHSGGTKEHRTSFCVTRAYEIVI